MSNVKKVRIASGVARAAVARNSAGVMKHRSERRSKDARKSWEREVEHDDALIMCVRLEARFPDWRFWPDDEGGIVYYNGHQHVSMSCEDARDMLNK